MRTTSLSTARTAIGAYLVLAVASLNFAAVQDVPSALTIDESSNAVYSSDQSGTLTMRQGVTENGALICGYRRRTEYIRSFSAGTVNSTPPGRATRAASWRNWTPVERSSHPCLPPALRER